MIELNEKHIKPIRIKPSQWTNFSWIIFGVASFFIFPLLVIVSCYKIAETYFTYFDFYDEKVIIQTGVFSLKKDEIFYYRIKAIHIEEPFLFRLVGLMNIKVLTSDSFINEYNFNGIIKKKGIANLLSRNVEYERKIKDVKENDIYILNK